MKLIKRWICWWIGHDHDMVFLNERSLDWTFVCRRCGHQTTDIFEAE